MASEMELLQALRKGSEAVWEEAFQLLYPCVFAAARHPLAGLTPSEAEDVAIETLTELITKVQTVADWEGLRCLAVTMSARRAISEKRKATAQKRGGGQVASIEQLQEESEGAFEPAERLAENLQPRDLKELSVLLREAMEPLEPLTRRLVYDYLVEGIPYKELAEKHEIPIGSVGVHLSRGLRKIRQGIEQKPRLLKEIRNFLR